MNKRTHNFFSLINIENPASSGCRKIILSNYRDFNEMYEEVANKEKLSKPNSF